MYSVVDPRPVPAIPPVPTTAAAAVKDDVCKRRRRLAGVSRVEVLDNQIFPRRLCSVLSLLIFFSGGSPRSTPQASTAVGMNAVASCRSVSRQSKDSSTSPPSSP